MKGKETQSTQYTIYMRSIQNERIMREARIMDYRRLQEDLRDYFGSVMLSGFPMAAIETISVDCASESELLKLAKYAGLNLRKYED